MTFINLDQISAMAIIDFLEAHSCFYPGWVLLWVLRFVEAGVAKILIKNQTSFLIVLWVKVPVMAFWDYCFSFIE